jgi:hypothetical protein
LFSLAVIAVALTCLPEQTLRSGPPLDQTTAVVVGQVLSGQVSANSATFTLLVVRTLTGDPVPGSRIGVAGTLARGGNGDPTGAYGMWFLRKGSGGQWALSPVQQGPFDLAYYPLSATNSPAGVVTNAQPSTLSDQIAVEIVAALPSYSGPVQLHQLASGLLATVDSSFTQELFQSLRANLDPELKFIALARLLKTGDPTALAEVASDVGQMPQLTTTFFVIPGILGRRDSNPTAIGYLGTIAASSDTNVQRAAATALKYIHTRDTLPFLAKLLESNDPTARELAMSGLSRFVENLPIETQYNTLNGKAVLQQGPAPYRNAQTDKYSLATRSIAQATETEAAFLQFWQSWWASMKHTVMGSGQ